MDAGQMKRLIELDDKLKALDAQAEPLRKEREALSAELVESFTQDGLSSANMDGRTLYLHVQAWAGHNGDAKAAVDALRAEGLEDCLMLGTQRLSARVREMGEEEFFAAYPALKEHIRVDVRSSIRVRKAS